MMTTGAEDVVEKVNKLLEAENVAEKSDEDAYSGSGVYVPWGVSVHGVSSESNVCSRVNLCVVCSSDVISIA